AGLTHLVLPGGESTTLHHLLVLFGLREPIVAAHRRGDLALFGTCAGAILLGRASHLRPPRLGLLDVGVVRNAYGRQAESFAADVEVPVLGAPFPAVFIRAPRFCAPGPDVRVIGRRGDEPVLVEAPGLLAATFHPELTDDTRLHRRFLDMPLPATTSDDAAGGVLSARGPG
ncbi:MAG: pyridoxal 5'-phosphate synthase glutaminase subunit PdxT, partial [Planctomycetota bacterium]